MWSRLEKARKSSRAVLSSVRISTAANEMQSGETRLNGGDTAGLGADASGVFHPVWIDNHTGVPQVWTASVAVRGTVHR